MAFQIKDFSSVAASCINWMRATQKKVTDFSVGSVVRTMLEAASAEIEELYLRMFVGLKEAIPVAIYKSFDFERLAASPAAGTVRLTVTSSSLDAMIPANTVFIPDGYGVSFASLLDVTIPAGTTQVDISVFAQQAGTVGNVPAETPFSPQAAIDGFVSAVALFSFSSGSDEETDEEQKLRFGDFIKTLNRGTVSALLYGLTLANVKDASGNVTERVLHRLILEPWLTDPLEPVALVQAYIHNGTNVSASGALIARASDIIDGYYDETGAAVPGWKAAGVRVDVIAATTSLVPVSGVLTVASTFSSSAVLEQVEAAVQDYIAALGIGSDVIFAEVVAAAMNIEGVINFIPSAPLADVPIAQTAKAMPGAITITVA